MGSGAKIILGLVIAAAAATAGVVYVVPALTPENAAPESGIDNPGTGESPLGDTNEPEETGNGAPPSVADPDIIAQGWDTLPVTPYWSKEVADESPFRRYEADVTDYFKAVPAPDGGIFLFNSSTSAAAPNICVERYDRDLKYVTSPDLGLHLLGFPPYAEQHHLNLFDVKQSGENYYLVFSDHTKPQSIFLMKYDRDLKPIYERPAFIDYGLGPALVEANGKIYVFYSAKPKEGESELAYIVYKTTIVERRYNIEGKDEYYIHKIHRETLPFDSVKDCRSHLFPSVAYNAQTKEFCVAYNAHMEDIIYGDHYAQIFDENWKKKGGALNLSARACRVGRTEEPHSVVPSVTVREGNYFFLTDGFFQFRKTKFRKKLPGIAILKYDKDLKFLGAKPVYCKMVDKNNKTEVRDLLNGSIINYGDGLAVVNQILVSAVLNKLDCDLNVISAALLNGGIPKKTDLFVNANDIERYPPKGILGCEQLLRIPVDNRGMKKTAKPVSVEMYYQNSKVASGTIKKPPSFADRQYAELIWTVPEDIQQEEIDVRIKIVPDESVEEYSTANNTVTITFPVWDKGLVRGYLQDGSLGIVNWLPLEGAEVTITAGDYTATATTDKTGYYEFDRVPFGDYKLEIANQGYNSLEVNRKLVKRFPVVTYRDELDNHGRIEITVNPDKAAGSCAVMLSGGIFTDVDAEKAENGKYVIDIPVGSYSARLTAAGFIPFHKDNIQVGLGQTTSVSVTMEEATFSIVKGFVCNAYGEPIANAAVTFVQNNWLSEESDRPEYSVVSDAEGKFTISLTGYEKKSVRYQDSDGNWKTRIERGDKIKGSVNWAVNAKKQGEPEYNDTISFRTGYEEYCEFYLVRPDEKPKKIGYINAYVAWKASSDFPGWLTYPELHAYAWYGLFAAAVVADYNPGKEELIMLHVGVQGLAYEMHAVSGKLSGSPKTAAKMGWKQWGSKALSLGSKLRSLKNTIENKPEDSGNRVPSVYETICDTIKENVHLGPTLFIPGIDKHKTSVRVDLIQIVGTSGDDEGKVLWSSDKQFFSHTSKPDDTTPNTHAEHFTLPKGLNIHRVQTVVYLKLQKLSLDGKTPTGPVPFYTNQYIKLVWDPGRNKLSAHYVAEYKYLQITGLTFE